MKILFAALLASGALFAQTDSISNFECETYLKRMPEIKITANQDQVTRLEARFEGSEELIEIGFTEVSNDYFGIQYSIDPLIEDASLQGGSLQVSAQNLKKLASASDFERSYYGNNAIEISFPQSPLRGINKCKLID